jgi:hypothetical protein
MAKPAERGGVLGQAMVEVTAILAETLVPSGRLAAWRDDDAIEIAAEATGPIVILKVAGKPFARAVVRQMEDRTVATIVEIGEASDCCNEWRFVKSQAAGG